VDCYKIALDTIERAKASCSSQKKAWEQVLLLEDDLSFRYFFFRHWIASQQIALMFDLVTTLGGASHAAMERFLQDPTLNPYGQGQVSGGFLDHGFVL
jgi:hypothetical protein